jgi:hypothetical protein
MGTNFVDEDPRHITLGTFQTPEGPSEIELNIVFLALHAHSDQYPSLRVELQPQVVD